MRALIILIAALAMVQCTSITQECMEVTLCTQQPTYVYGGAFSNNGTIFIRDTEGNITNMCNSCLFKVVEKSRCGK
jgi:hypothetical protein